VLNVDTGQVVSHKEVCQYFKTEGVAFNPTVVAGAAADSPIKPRVQSGAGR